MTFEKKEITVPSYLITAIVSILITVIGYAIGITKVAAQTETKVNSIEMGIIRLDNSKASVEAVDAITLRENDMQQSLLRIENKLDNFIQTSNK